MTDHTTQRHGSAPRGPLFREKLDFPGRMLATDILHSLEEHNEQQAGGHDDSKLLSPQALADDALRLGSTT